MTPSTIFVVDDDPALRAQLSRWLERAGYEPEAFVDGPAMLHALRYRAPDAICLDLELGAMSGVDVMRRLRDMDPSPPVIVVTSDGGTEAVVEMMRLGASDYQTKPLERPRLMRALEQAVSTYRSACHERERELTRSKQGLGRLVGRSRASLEIFERVRRVARTDVTVLILGESGTGKELVAREIHEASGRASGAFVALNCGAVPESLLESELFGHVKGAFTGASQSRPGRFEQADGGTLFLDEVAELSPQAQVRLLRVLQESVVTRVGSLEEKQVNVRVISATHRDLRARIEERRFREDLYYRLMVYPLEVPPLRERLEDIPLLVTHFLDKHAPGRGISRANEEALAALVGWHWPGNVRELENAIQYALVHADGDTLCPGDLPPSVGGGGRMAAASRSLPAQRDPDAAAEGRGEDAGEATLNLRELERRAIVAALASTDGNVTLASRRLGLGRSTLYRKMASYGIDGG